MGMATCVVSVQILLHNLVDSNPMCMSDTAYVTNVLCDSCMVDATHYTLPPFAW